MLESNCDGMGGWKVQDTLGMPWIDVPEPLRVDLMTWRWLRRIGERQWVAQKDKRTDDH